MENIYQRDQEKTRMKRRKPFNERWYPNMQRRIAFLVAIFLMALSMAPGLAEQAAPVTEALVTSSVDIANDPVLVEKTLGDYYVAITGATVTKDYEGKPCIAFSFRWSHNEKDAQSFLLAFGITPFQNGIELERAIMADGVDTKQTMLDVKAGFQQNVQVAYVLADTTSKVDIEVAELFNFTGDDKLTFAFNLQ
jgi:hypothetical protein